MSRIDVGLDVFLGSWTNAKPYLRNAAGVQITRGRQNFRSEISPSSATMTLDNRDGRWTVRNPLGAWYGQLVQGTPCRISVPSSLAGINCYLRFEGDDLSYFSTPDSASLQITTGTLSVRADVRPTDGFHHAFLGKWGATGKAWVFAQQDDGTLVLFHWDGSNQFQEQSTLPMPYFGSRIAVRADYNISAQTITYYTAPTMAGAWTQLGSVVTTTASALSGAAGQIVQVGAVNSTGIYGEMYEAQIYSTASLVADPVFTSQTPGATSFTDGQSNTWTQNGTAELSGRLYRFHGELAALPKFATPNNKESYATSQAGGILRRLSQQQAPANSAMFRAFVRLSGTNAVVDYWPFEDGSGSTVLASANGGSPAQYTPVTSLGAFSGFVSSAPIPTLNGGIITCNVRPYTANDNVVRFLMAVPAAGDQGGDVLCRVYTQGTVARLDMIYNLGGSLTLVGFDVNGSQLFTSGAVTFGANGTLLEMEMALQQSGSNITWHIDGINPGASSQVGLSNTLSSATVGPITQVQFNPGGGLTTTSVGHCVVQSVYSGSQLQQLASPLNAWYGETAASRISRICAEEGYACRITGPPARSQAMGYQTQETIPALLQECETTDQGMLFEPRQVLGFGYVTNWALCQQPVMATADMSAQTVDPSFSPASDDTLVINDVTMTALQDMALANQSFNGASFRAVLSTGPMSTTPPPAGVGRFDTQITVNPQQESQLPNLAGWYLHVSTVNEDRYPAIPFQMARSTQSPSVPLLDIGNYLQVINVPYWVPAGPVKQLVAGYSETLGPQPQWMISFNGIPETPYEVGVVGDPVYGHADTDGSQLAAPVTSGATSMLVAPSPIPGAFLGEGAMSAANFNAANSDWTTWTGISDQVNRVYLTTSPTVNADMTQMINAGCKLLISLQPPYNPVSATELANIVTFCQALKTAGANAELCIWHEPFFSGLTAAQFIAAVQYYGPSIRQYFPLVFVTAESAVAFSNENSFYPGDAWVDKVATDYYTPTRNDLALCAAPADSANPPKPFGIWEFNFSTDPVSGNSQAVVTSAFQYITSYFQARLAAKQPCADVCLFNGGPGTGGFNQLGDDTNNECGFESTVGDWVPNFGCTAVHSTAQAHSGSGSMLVTATGTSWLVNMTGPPTSFALPVVALTSQVWAFIWVKAATVAETIQPLINWYTSGNVFVSNSFGTGVTDSTTGWTQLSMTATAPATAAFATLAFQATSTVSGHQHYAGDAQLMLIPPSNDITTAINFRWDYRVALFQAMWTALTTNSGRLWTTAGGDFPFDLTIGGEQVTVSAISGTPQALTVTRSVNGVVKAHNAGEDVRLTHPMIVALGS